MLQRLRIVPFANTLFLKGNEYYFTAACFTCVSFSELSLVTYSQQSYCFSSDAILAHEDLERTLSSS